MTSTGGTNDRTFTAALLHQSLQKETERRGDVAPKEKHPTNVKAPTVVVSASEGLSSRGVATSYQTCCQTEC